MTEEQKKIIDDIQDVTGIMFDGSSKEEAQNFIDKHQEIYKAMSGVARIGIMI